ncbi:MAG: hypothetical protein KG028_08315 [Actinobacteria bacterium]|nr:hypothetical protein [Actinomycetota bacterium]
MSRATRRLLLAVGVVALLGLVVARVLESTSPSSSCADPAAPLAPPDGWEAVPAAAVGHGALRSLQLATDGPEDLRSARFLLVRIATDGGAPPEIYLDTVGGRERGGWTYQSALSASAWNLMVESDGRIFRHDGGPTTWSWQEAEATAGYRWQAHGTAVVVCIPVDLLATDGTLPSRVRVAAQRDDRWLPAPFLAGAALPPATPTLGVAQVRAPGRLAFAYQWAPWAVRDADPAGLDLTRASQVYGRFDHVVFGAGLQRPDHPSHANTERLVRQLAEDHPGQERWGYVSMLREADDWYGHAGVARRIDQWARLPVTGIFLDEFDLCDAAWADCGIAPDGSARRATRERQRAAVEHAHARGLAVFANAHSAHGVLVSHAGDPTPLGPGSADRPADMYLLENPTVWDGRWWTGLDLAAALARFHDAPVLARGAGVRLAVVDTGAGAIRDTADTTQEYAASWWRAVQAGAAAHGFTNAVYSASDELGTNLALLGPPPDGVGLDERGWRFAGPPVVVDGGVTLARPVVDTEGHTIGELRTTFDPDVGTVTVTPPRPN